MNPAQHDAVPDEGLTYDRQQLARDERPPSDRPALYTAAEAAMILRVKASWLERQAARRKIPFTMLGRSYRFTATHIAIIVQLYEQAPAVVVDVPATPRHRARPADSNTDPSGDRPLRPRPGNRTGRGSSCEPGSRPGN